MLDSTHMAAKAVQVSLDEDLLERIDRDPETRQRGRSAVIRSALQLYLRAKERHAVDQAILQAYEGHADELLKEVEDLLEGQAWPET